MKKFLIFILLIANGLAVASDRSQERPYENPFISRSPLFYEHPYCLPDFFIKNEENTRAASSNSTAFGLLNGSSQAVEFNLTTRSLFVAGYASQYSPTSNSGSQTAAGTQFTYDMIAIGHYDYYRGVPVASFNPNGAGINGIGTGGVVGQVITNLGSTSRAIKLAVQTNHAGVPELLYVVGYVNTLSKDQWEIVIASYLLNTGPLKKDGSLNPAFNPNFVPPASNLGLPNYGIVITSFSDVSDQGLAIALDADNKILITGQSAGKLFVARYLPNGSIDTTFNAQGTAAVGGTQPGVFICSIAGLATTANTGPATIGADIGYGITIRDNGKIVVAGTGITQGGLRVIILLCLNPDGSLDTSFGPQTLYPIYPGQLVLQKGKVITELQGIDDEGLAINLDAQGKILVAGTSLDYSTGIYQMALVRYTPQGLLDTTFPFRPNHPGSGSVLLSVAGSTSASATSVNVQSDAKIVIAGFNNYFQQQITFCVARYLPTGYLDTQNFNPTGICPTVVPTNPPIYLSGATFYKQPGVVTVSIQGYNDKSFGAAIQPVTLPKFPAEEIFAVGSSLSYSYLQQYYAFAFIRLSPKGALDNVIAIPFTNV